MTTNDPFHARTKMTTALGERWIYRLSSLDKAGLGKISRLPYSIKILLESALRNLDGFVVTESAVKALAGYDARNVGEQEIPFMPGRVVLQDFTGVPAVVDLAAMRAAIVRLTGREDSASKVNPLVPCDLVIDHSVQVDAFANNMALTINSQKEFERNTERYQFLKWGQKAFDNFRVVPPATGIVHQVNLEYLAKVVWDNTDAESHTTQGPTLYPDSLVGTDSHTTMINGLGVVGWGVGGIEAEAVMLGQPIYMLIPEVVGFGLNGKLPEGSTATDLVLRVTELLRELGVVGKFVEFFGPGLAEMPLATRGTVANMAPEYGATMGFFPVDEQTTRYLTLTGRDAKLVETVEQYSRAQGLWRDDAQPPVYTQTVELDLSTVEPALAGPKRPQDRIALSQMQSTWRRDLAATFNRPQASPTSTAAPTAAAARTDTAAAIAENDTDGVIVEHDGASFALKHGAVVIAAITSCTNTSNPQVMIAAGLLARNARQRGLNRRPWVKTSLAPGSKVVSEYLDQADLTKDLEGLGFHLVGYGCTTCIGNSGPLPAPISQAINEHDLVASAVLSGNRNFEGRINPDVKANYLASPPLVVAYAIAGTVDIDLQNDPIGTDTANRNVYLRDIWPTQAQIDEAITANVTREQFTRQYTDIFAGSQSWQQVQSASSPLYPWDGQSTYVQEPPFFANLSRQPGRIEPITGARCLVKVGDSVTTDHISPAGAIKPDSPAGKFLVERGVSVNMFNSYGSRRGNDRVMTRGTFANIRVRNHLAPDTEGGWTTYLSKLPDKTATGEKAGPVIPIYEAATQYQETGVPLVVLAGKDYGMGSSRDWAAKGTFLLGIKAVIAESFERIHRSNLVGMGVLPLCYEAGQNAESLGLDGTEIFGIDVDDGIEPRQKIKVTAHKTGDSKIEFATTCRIDTPVEVDYYRNGGILHTVLRKMADSQSN